MHHQHSDGWNSGENVAGELGLGNGEKHDAKDRPGKKQRGGRREAPRLSKMENTGTRRTDKQDGPRGEGNKQNGEVKPEGLNVLEFGSEISLEVVFDDEDSEEIGIAVSAQDVPRQCGEAETEECDGMKKPEDAAPESRLICALQ